MAREKWKYVSDKYGQAHYYDSRKYNASTDPGGDVHFSKRSSGRKKAQKAMSGRNIAFYEHTLLATIVLVLLFRWFMMVEYGFTDDLFIQYPGAVDAWGNSTELYYFDIFKWLKAFAAGVADFKNVFVDVFSALDGAFSDSWVANVANSVLFLLNLILAIFKVVVLVPFQLVGLILGGFVYPWTLPGGWIYQTLHFNIPYMDAQAVNDGTNALWDWLTDWHWPWDNGGLVIN